MAKQRYLNTRFWRDNYISELDPSEKLLFIYLLTNPDTNISGIYEIPLRIIALDTGIDKEMVIKIIKRFTADNKIVYKSGWVAIKNFIKHQALNPKIEKGIKTELSNAPAELVKWVKKGTKIAYDSLSDLNTNTNTNINTNVKVSSSKKSRNDPQVRCIIDIIWTVLKQDGRIPSGDKDYYHKAYSFIDDYLNKWKPATILGAFDYAIDDDFWKTKVTFGNLSSAIKQFEGKKGRSKIEKANEEYFKEQLVKWQKK
jgi:hypothetical protein